MEIWLYWLIAAGAMFVLEIMTAGFLVFWFGVAALVTMIVSFFIANTTIQLIIFLVLSVLLVLLTKPLVNKLFVKENKENTNVYTILGKKAIVTVEIDSIMGTGQIKVDSDVWSAISEDDTIIPIGTQVEILKIDGVKVVVKKLYK